MHLISHLIELINKKVRYCSQRTASGGFMLQLLKFRLQDYETLKRFHDCRLNKLSLRKIQMHSHCVYFKTRLKNSEGILANNVRNSQQNVKIEVIS